MAAPTSKRDRIALAVLQLGAVAVVLVALPYKTFDLDRYFVPKELALHACAAVAAVSCVSRRRHFTFSVVDVLLAGFLMASALSTLLAGNRWAAERALAISLSAVALFWVAQALRRAGLVRPLIVALAVGVVVGAATSLAQAYGLQSEYFSLNRAPGGTFGNRNFVAHLAAIGMPVVVLVALTARRGFGSVFGGVGMAIVAAALVLSRSRGAWLAVLGSAVPIALLALVTWGRWSEERTRRRLVVIGGALAAGVVAAVAIPNRLEWKSESPYLDSAAGLVNYKEGSGAGRLMQYTNSLKLAAAHPVLGVGPGNWAAAYPAYAKRNDPSMSQEGGTTANPWPSSDWVAYLSERGVVGCGLLLLSVFGLMGRALFDLRRGRTSDQTRDPERVLTAIALVGTLIATLIVGAFDAVLLVAVPAFFVWTLAGALSPADPGGRSLEWRGASFALFVAAIGVITVGRSAAQLAAITVFSTNTRIGAYQTAAHLDPGSYRIRTRLAQAYIARGDCTHARVEARAMRSLFPSAAEPRRQLTACGSR